MEDQNRKYECQVCQHLESRLEDYRKADTATHKELWNAINELRTNDAVQDSKYDTILKQLNDLANEVKALQDVPGNNWKELVKTLVTTICSILVGFTLAKIGIF